MVDLARLAKTSEIPSGNADHRGGINEKAVSFALNRFPSCIDPFVRFCF